MPLADTQCVSVLPTNSILAIRCQEIKRYFLLREVKISCVSSLEIRNMEVENEQERPILKVNHH